ncbi:aminotransferase class I/II-fold pyridoxal phosphate-dependent enzyme [Candidatus Poseidonia alphae]|nr:aminotransferase class I/II-fold pyridoxal phosphate-dependent enzyme [Candidatus Poseidonia alphae]MDA8749380.1 aminotransferase class I/II-fold pyridoxal phosphate-dependent enzyme [Candidatus Poseidonia alphae]MDB2569450.1 aminotransferase class I/II-fold pyridoxal phosphate-dependent enzyme [Candidatus Poseidonia alphae]
MRTYSDRALAIQPTGVRKMFDLAGDDVISFGLGEPDFQPPRVAIDAFYQAMLDGHNKYTTTAGMPALRQKIADSWTSYQAGMTEENVCMTMSGTNALLNLFMTLVNPGENILLPEPYFPLYGPDATLVGGESQYYPCLFENEFVPRVEDLETLVDEKTVAILYNFPSNPTGGTLNESQRDDLLAFAKKHDLWIISDEVYDRIVFEGAHVSFMGTDYDKLMVVNSFSKTFAMTGWRIGYIISPNLEAMKEVIKIQYYISACSNDAMQHAVLEAMEKANDYPSMMAEEFKQRCDLIVDRLNAMPGVECQKPKGAIYVFPKVTVDGMNSQEIAMELLKDGVLCSPGSAFGPSGEGHLRFAYTISQEDISRGMDKVETTLLRLQNA